MNNEPVVWMREDGVIAFHKQKKVDSQGYKWQPLYTHPADLTNEEIKQIAKEYLHRHLLYVVTEEVVDDFQLQNVVVSDFDFKRNQWIEDNKEKIEEALEWDLKQRQPMQILDDGRIVPVFKDLTDEDLDEIMVEVEAKLAEEGCYISYCCNTIRILSDAILKRAQEK